MTLVIAGMLAGLLQMVKRSDDPDATMKIIVDANQLFERMELAYRLRAID